LHFFEVPLLSAFFEHNERVPIQTIVRGFFPFIPVCSFFLFMLLPSVTPRIALPWILTARSMDKQKIVCVPPPRFLSSAFPYSVSRRRNDLPLLKPSITFPPFSSLLFGPNSPRFFKNRLSLPFSFSVVSSANVKLPLRTSAFLRPAPCLRAPR